VVISQHLSAPPPQLSARRPDLADLDAVITRVLAKDPASRYSRCSEFAAALTGQPRVGADETVAGSAPDRPTRQISAPAEAAPAGRGRRPAVLFAAAATVALLVVAGIVGANLLRHRAAESADAPGVHTDQPSAAPSVELIRYITDPSGKLTAASHTAVEGALSRLSARHNVHLWVAYVDDFSGLTPIRWAENAMRTNGFTDTDGLLAIDTTNRTFAFHAPKIMKVSTELIRKERIAPAVHRDEWARAAVAAANGLEAAG
jgi:TPM domain